MLCNEPFGCACKRPTWNSRVAALICCSVVPLMNVLNLIFSHMNVIRLFVATVVENLLQSVL